MSAVIVRDVATTIGRSLPPVHLAGCIGDFPPRERERVVYDSLPRPDLEGP